MSAPFLLTSSHELPSFPLSSPRFSRREDAIFRAILPRSRAALAVFEFDEDWAEEVLAEGDIIAPLIS